MKKRKLLEYFEGTPDVICDMNTSTSWHWNNENATCFGYFPVSIDNDYEFLTSNKMHSAIAEMAAEKVMGKAISQIRDRYESYTHWIEDQCYDKSYGLGRYWGVNARNYPNLLAFWYPPSSKLVEAVVNNLKINPSKCIIVLEPSNTSEKDITVKEYIEMGTSGDEDVKSIINSPFKIDSKVAELIRSYNKPDETWQSRKEKKGWNTLAQRNAMIYQEGKEPKKQIKENINNMKNNSIKKSFQTMYQ